MGRARSESTDCFKFRRFRSGARTDRARGANRRKGRAKWPTDEATDLPVEPALRPPNHPPCLDDNWEAVRTLFAPGKNEEDASTAQDAATTARTADAGGSLMIGVGVGR